MQQSRSPKKTPRFSSSLNLPVRWIRGGENSILPESPFHLIPHETRKRSGLPLYNRKIYVFSKELKFIETFYFRLLRLHPLLFKQQNPLLSQLRTTYACGQKTSASDPPPPFFSRTQTSLRRIKYFHYDLFFRIVPLLAVQDK